jgi:hypothetical protein
LFVGATQLFRDRGVTIVSTFTRPHWRQKDISMKTKTSILRYRPTTRLSLAVAAVALALLSIPHGASAQGIIGGAEEGVRRGNRAAGPVGGVVGGAIGAGVGGAVGAVNGVLGVPNRGYRCRGYYNRRGHYRCYR